MRNGPPAGADGEASSTHYVAIGASAGGLEACAALIAGLPRDSGLVYVYVQHMSPAQPSMMAEIIGARTAMPVLEVRDGMQPLPDHLYVNAPGAALKIENGRFRCEKAAPAHGGGDHGFDVLLASLAAHEGRRTICVVLSGNGDDGSVGLSLVKTAGGHIIAQNPDEAAFSGMPRSAIATGKVDQVLLASQIAAAIVRWRDSSFASQKPEAKAAKAAKTEWLHAVLEVVGAQTGVDFTLYKTGTLLRRIISRMHRGSKSAADEAAYLAQLREDPSECAALAADMLIHVTRFFRDLPVFDELERTILPDLVARVGGAGPLRLWIAACSTGEEVWSIAMLLHEAIEQSGRSIHVQIFASDLDALAISTARSGHYTGGISSDVSAARLKRYFVEEDGGYRVCGELRGWVVFAVQNLLSDPPFARVGLVACRNLMIYFTAEAQAKAMALFHFALEPGGILLLGSSETPGDIEATFETVSKSNRIFRRIGPGRSLSPAALAFPADYTALQRQGQAGHRASPIADDYRQSLIGAFTPACVMVDRAGSFLYALGPIDRYLQISNGPASQNILTMLPYALRASMRDAIGACRAGAPAILVEGGRHSQAQGGDLFEIEVREAASPRSDLILVAFRDVPAASVATADQGGRENAAELTVLNHRLKAELVFTSQ